MSCYRSYISAILLVTIFTAAQLGWGTENEDGAEVEDYFRTLDFSSYQRILQQANSFSLEVQPPDTDQLNKDIYAAKSKSTKKAFLLSLVLPGAGELYGDSKLKAAAFLGLEALFWYSYFHYDGKGDDKKAEYRGTADANWNANEYRDYLIDQYFVDERLDYGLNGDTIYRRGYDIFNPGAYTIDSLLADTARYYQFRSNEDYIYNLEESLSTAPRDPDELGFTHHSVKIDRSQYYENIGKYDQFAYGWGGTELDPVPLIRSIYLGMRKDANDLYDKAKWSAIASIGNHILSAIDAALTVKSYNRKQDRFIDEANLRLRMVPEAEGVSPRAVLTLKFD